MATFVCKYTGTDNCEFQAEDDDLMDLYTLGVVHLEQQHRSFLVDLFKKIGYSEVIRVVADAIER